MAWVRMRLKGREIGDADALAEELLQELKALLFQAANDALYE